jgi:hypothetical protein
MLVAQTQARGGAHVKHYIAILVQNDVGDWRALFPDVPGCEAKGFSLYDVQFAAATALVRHIRDSGSPPPLPMDMHAVQQKAKWLADNKINLARVVTMEIPLST